MGKSFNWKNLQTLLFRREKSWATPTRIYRPPFRMDSTILLLTALAILLCLRSSKKLPLPLPSFQIKKESTDSMLKVNKIAIRLYDWYLFFQLGVYKVVPVKVFRLLWWGWHRILLPIHVPPDCPKEIKYCRSTVKTWIILHTKKLLNLYKRPGLQMMVRKFLTKKKYKKNELSLQSSIRYLYEPRKLQKKETGDITVWYFEFSKNFTIYISKLW